MSEDKELFEDYFRNIKMMYIELRIIIRKIEMMQKILCKILLLGLISSFQSLKEILTSNPGYSKLCVIFT